MSDVAPAPTTERDDEERAGQPTGGFDHRSFEERPSRPGGIGGPPSLPSTKAIEAALAAGAPAAPRPGPVQVAVTTGPRTSARSLPGSLNAQGTHTLVLDLASADAKLVKANLQVGERYGQLLVRALAATADELEAEFTGRGPKPVAAGFVMDAPSGRRSNLPERRRLTFRISVANAEALADLMDRCGLNNYAPLLERALQLAFGPKKAQTPAGE